MKTSSDFLAPPQAVEAEQAVLASMMLDPPDMEGSLDLLTADDFYHAYHKILFKAIQHLAANKVPVDVVTVGELAEKLNPAIVGYAIDLVSSQPGTANLMAHANIVKEKSNLRRIIEAGTDMINAAFACGRQPSEDVLSAALSSLTAIGMGGSVSEVTDVSEALADMSETIRRKLMGEAPATTSFGLAPLDRMTGGKAAGELIIVAGRPSTGKTCFAMQGAIASRDALIFSFETSAERLVTRMTASVGRFPLSWLLDPFSRPEGKTPAILEASREVLTVVRPRIYHKSRLTVSQLRRIAIKEHASRPISEIIIDHLGYMRNEGQGRADQEMGHTTKELKSLAKELGVPVVLLMQLNRGVEHRVDKRPLLSDLRECGAAEEDADIVLMLYRDGYYNPLSTIADTGEIFVRKSRDGETGVVWVKPILEEMRFDETSAPPPSPASEPRTGLVYARPGEGSPARPKPRSVPRADFGS